MLGGFTDWQQIVPGFKGSKSDAPDLLVERGAEYAELQEMLYALRIKFVERAKAHKS